MKITLPDGKSLELEPKTTVAGVAQAISEGLTRNAVAGVVNGKLVDTSYAIEEDAEVRIVTLKDKEGLDILRHTCSHVLAQAVKTVYPTCSLAIGPTVENGLTRWVIEAEYLVYEPETNEEALQIMLRGKTIPQARTILNTLEHVKETKITLLPSWMPQMPLAAQNIRVIINTAAEEEKP